MNVCVHDGRGLAQFFGGDRSKAGEEVDAENLCPSNCVTYVDIDTLLTLPASIPMLAASATMTCRNYHSASKLLFSQPLQSRNPSGWNEPQRV